MGASSTVSDLVGDQGGLLFRALLEQPGLGLAVVDASGRLTMVSRGLEEFVGQSYRGVRASEFPGRFHLYDAEGDRLLDPSEVPLTRATAGETVRDAVISVRRPGEPVRYLRCNAAPLRGTEGEPFGAFALIADVTAERTAAARHDMIRRLLLDTVNHQLRTPLTVVLANAELLADLPADLPDTVRSPLAAITRASEVLRDTVQRVSDLADLEAGETPQCRLTDVRTLLLSVSNRYGHQAEQRGITLIVECPTDLQWRLEPTLVRKAIAAMVHNALTHGPANSLVTAAAIVGHDLLTLRVTDEGTGLPDHDLERLTQPFERGPSTLDAQHRNGLGLALAQAVAASHHGALLFKNYQPRGFSTALLLA